MATFILVAGATLTGGVWDKVAALLQQAGHRPVLVDLPGWATVPGSRCTT